MLTALYVLLTAMPFVIAIGLGLALPLLGLLLYRRFEAGVALVCLIFIVDAAFFGATRLMLGINIYGNDLAYALLAAVAATRWLLARDMPSRPALWLVFVAVVAAAVVIGLVEHGRRAGVQAREIFYALACASYAMSFVIDEAKLRRVLHLMAASGIALLVIVAYRWVVYYTPIPDLLPPGGQWSPDGPTRVIASHEALLLAQWLVLSLVLAQGSGATRLGRWLAPLLLGAVVALQHRSVWIAALVGLVVALAAVRAAQSSRLMQLAAIAISAALVALPLVFAERFSPLTREVSRSAATATAGQGTVYARLHDWRTAFTSYARGGPRVWLAGEGYGRDANRTTVTESGERRIVQFGLHNHYLTLLINTGLIGLAAFLAVSLGTAWALYRRCRSREAGWVAPSLLTLLMMQMAYHLPYAADPFQHLLLGVAVAWVASQRRDAEGQRAMAGKAAPPAARDVAWR